MVFLNLSVKILLFAGLSVIAGIDLIDETGPIRRRVRQGARQYFYVENSKNSNSASYSKDALPSAYVFTGNRYATYEYDSLNRLTERRFSTTAPLYNNYTYKMSANRNTGDSTLYRTEQLSTEFIANDSFTYYYDELGNITSVKPIGGRFYD